jgi:hypothetical protein
MEVFTHPDLLREISKYFDAPTNIYLIRTCKSVYYHLTTIIRPFKIKPNKLYSYAIENNHLSIVQYLVECKYRIPYSAAGLASFHDNLKILEYIHNCGIPLTGCMARAIARRNRKIIGYLASVYKETNGVIIKNIHIDDFKYLMNVDYFVNEEFMLNQIFTHNRIDLLDYLVKNHKISWTCIIGVRFNINTNMQKYLSNIDLFPTFK